MVFCQKTEGMIPLDWGRETSSKVIQVSNSSERWASWGSTADADAALEVLQVLYQTVVMKRELS